MEEANCLPWASPPPRKSEAGGAQQGEKNEAEEGNAAQYKRLAGERQADWLGAVQSSVRHAGRLAQAWFGSGSDINGHFRSRRSVAWHARQ